MSQPIHCLNCYVFSLGQRKAKVLIAGADWSERSALAHALEARGYNVLLARSARQAAELMRLQGPDLVLMDLGLEDLAEEGVQDAVRSLGWGTQLVAWCSPQEASAPGRLAGIGARDYVLRPLDLPELEQLIDCKIAGGRARGSKLEWLAPAPKLETQGQAQETPPLEPPSPVPGEGVRVRAGSDPLDLLAEDLKRTSN